MAAIPIAPDFIAPSPSRERAGVRVIVRSSHPDYWTAPQPAPGSTATPAMGAPPVFAAQVPSTTPVLGRQPDTAPNR